MRARAVSVRRHIYPDLSADLIFCKVAVSKLRLCTSCRTQQVSASRNARPTQRPEPSQCSCAAASKLPVGLVLTARLLDRVGKGIRGVRRDALVADIAPPELRGAGYGFFNLVSGLALLLASLVAGLLWDVFAAPATFMTGAVFSGQALALLVLSGTKRPTPPPADTM